MGIKIALPIKLKVCVCEREREREGEGERGEVLVKEGDKFGMIIRQRDHWYQTVW